MMKKPKNKMLAHITFKDGRKRMIADYVSTKVLDGMVWVASESGEGYIFPKETVEIIEVRRSMI